MMCIVLGLHAGGWADEEGETTVLEAIVVTDSVKSNTLLDTPASITVLTEKDITNSGQSNLAELIATIPGVVNQKAGSKTYLSIRGTRGSLSNGPMIYLDGRPINSGQYGYSKVDTIPLDNVVRIEVVKSPSAAIYGANAARGVILITTRSGKLAKKAFQGTVSGEFGNWDTWKTTASLMGNAGSCDYSVTGHAMEREGYRSSDDDVKSVDAQVNYNFDGGRVGFISGFNDSFVTYPKGLPEYQAERDRQSPGFNTEEDGSGYDVLPSETDELLANAGMRFNYDKNDWLINSSLTYTRAEEVYTKMDDFNNPDPDRKRDDYRDDRAEDRFDARLNVGKTLRKGALQNNLTLGMDYVHSDFSQERSYPFNTEALSSGMESGKAKADIDINHDIYAFNLNNDLSFKRFKLMTGLRSNYAGYDLSTKEPKSMDKDYNGKLDWNIAPSLSVVENGNVFVSYNHSNWFLPIGFYRLDLQYDNEQAKAEDLEPEIYDTWETGFKHRLSKSFNYSIIFYHTKTEDKVVSYYEDSSFRGYRNGGTSIHQGVELEADGMPLPWLGYRLTFTTIDAEWDEGNAKAYATPDATTTTVIDLAGKNVHYVPEYEYTAGLDFYLLRKTALGSMTLSLDVHGFGEQYEDYCNNLKMDGADFVDMKFTWTYGRYELYVAGSNIFNKEWDKYSNSTGLAHDRLTGGTTGIYPQDGRYVCVGGSIRL